MQFPKIKILQLPKKYLKISAWILGILVLLLLAGGTFAYSKREGLLH